MSFMANEIFNWSINDSSDKSMINCNPKYCSTIWIDSGHCYSNILIDLSFKIISIKTQFDCIKI